MIEKLKNIKHFCILVIIVNIFTVVWFFSLIGLSLTGVVLNYVAYIVVSLVIFITWVWLGVSLIVHANKIKTNSRYLWMAIISLALPFLLFSIGLLCMTCDDIKNIHKNDNKENCISDKFDKQ